jgi:hypothetical protein
MFFGMRFTTWMNGFLKWRPGSVIGFPCGSPNWVMMTCSTGETV